MVVHELRTLPYKLQMFFFAAGSSVVSDPFQMKSVPAQQLFCLSIQRM